MKVLIAVLSCELYRTNGNNQALRDTWLPCIVGADYKFFMGQGSKCTQPDEVYLDVQDDYSNVTYKAKEMYKWAASKDYDYVFKCFPDTYVCPERLLRSGFEKYDYSGNFACKPPTGTYVCGGTGCWISRRAYNVLISKRIPTEDTVLNPSPARPLRPRFSRAPERPQTIYPTIIKNIDTWAEDKWSGDVIRDEKTLSMHHDPRYEDNVLSSGPEVTNTKITQHLSKPSGEGIAAIYDKAWLYAKHEAWLRSLEGHETINRVAVITPTVASRRSLLEECKVSVKAQTWGGDILHAIGEDHAKVGAATMRNNIVHGVDPSYAWLAFVDDDDVLKPEHLATLVAASEGADVVYSDCTEEGFTKTWNTREFNYAEIKAANYIPVTALMRRSIFESIGGFQSEPYPGEDQHLWLRAALAGARFRYVPRTTWTYRKHPQHRFQSM
jgi:hypothetical protein